MEKALRIIVSSSLFYGDSHGRDTRYSLAYLVILKRIDGNIGGYR